MDQMIKDRIDALLEKRWGRFVWVIGIIVVGAGLILAGTWIAIMIGPPVLTGFDWAMAIFCGIIIGALLVIFISGAIYFIGMLVDWLWNG